MSAPDKREVVKSSAVLIASGEKVRFYRSVEDVPLGLRKRLIESTNSINSGTILIANRAARERILGVLRSAPEDVRKRICSALTGIGKARPPARGRWRRAVAVALALSAAAALGFWLAWWRWTP